MLFTNYVGVAFGDYYDASSERALLMAMGPDEPAFVGMEIWAAFVNPYSEHADLAAEYLAALYRCVPEMEKYNFYPDRNDRFRRRAPRKRSPRRRRSLRARRRL